MTLAGVTLAKVFCWWYLAARMSDESAAKKRTLPDWMRRHWTDAQRFMLMCMVVGLLCGLTAVAFHLAIHHLFDWLWHGASSLPTWLFITIMLAAPTLAGLAVGVWKDLEELGKMWKADTTWTPQMSEAERSNNWKGWNKAVQRSLDWVDDE